MYEKIAHLNVSDKIVDFNVEKGIKIARFIKENEVVRKGLEDMGGLIYDEEKLKSLLALLKKVHESNIELSFSECDMFFIIQGRISNTQLINYKNKKIIEEFLQCQNIKYMQERLKKNNPKKVLCHGDIGSSNVRCRLSVDFKIIDWELARMEEPILDIARIVWFREWRL